MSGGIQVVICESGETRASLKFCYWNLRFSTEHQCLTQVVQIELLVLGNFGNVGEELGKVHPDVVFADSNQTRARFIALLIFTESLSKNERGTKNVKLDKTHEQQQQHHRQHYSSSRN